MRFAVLSRAWLGSVDLSNPCGSEADSGADLRARLRLDEQKLGREMSRVF